MARGIMLAAVLASAAFARVTPPNAQERQYLAVMRSRSRTHAPAQAAPEANIDEDGTLGDCGSCGCPFCCVSSCDSRCGDTSDDQAECPTSGCGGCDCWAGFCLTTNPFKAEIDTKDTDFCLPDLFTATLSSWDALKGTDAVMRIVRRDTAAGFEREDVIASQSGAGDVRRGYFIRNLKLRAQWNVTEDGNGIVTGCSKEPASGSAFPTCIAEGAHYTGGGFMGGQSVTFWRQLTGVNSRVDLVLAGNSTDISAVMRVARVSQSGFAVDEVFNFNTDPIPASTFDLPSQCKP